MRTHTFCSLLFPDPFPTGNKSYNKADSSGFILIIILNSYLLFQAQ
jgi:hypothetical protein